MLSCFVVGMFSLRKRIEDSVLRAEMLGPSALEIEEANHINQEEVIREYDLWDDLAKSNDVLIKLADSAKVVDTLRDLKYKVFSFVSFVAFAPVNCVLVLHLLVLAITMYMHPVV